MWLSRARASRKVRLLAWGALILALAYFSWRGIWRGATNSTDLTYGYSAVQAWLLGQNPYDFATLEKLVEKGGGPIVSIAIGHGVYIPTTLPLFLPIAFGLWPEARLLGLVFNVGAVIFIALGLTRLLGWRPTEPRALVLMAFLLALAPVHTTIAFGQTALVATAALVAAMLLERSRRPVLAGVLYGLATAVKVQIGLPFLAYLLWRRRWATAAAAGLVLAGLTLLSVFRMEVAGVPWYASWQANLAWLTGPEGNGSPGPQNPDRISLVNLEYLLNALSPGGEWANLATLGFVGAASLALVWFIRGRQPRQELLALAIVAVLCLLVTYHRTYDAVLLALPIAWAFSVLRTPQWRVGVVALALCADFLVPIQSALNDLQQAEMLPPWLTGSPLWGTVLLVQHVWALVILVPVLLWAAARERRDLSSQAS